ncbi:chloride channel [Lipomyces oligophaga]|uniref:chloride channel n=1 Tax=Lipomyces oligophaga TaxID=45792 RepID=UPI0034CF3CF5
MASSTHSTPQTARFDEFSTIDWVQDANREQLRARYEKSHSLHYYGGRRPMLASLLNRANELLESIQGWVVLTLIGVLIGSIAAFLNIITEWLSDLKLGHCSTGFYLNESFCCWGADEGCPEWHEWSTTVPVFGYVFFVLASVTFAVTSAYIVKTYAPTAAGSGISEIKCIVSGFVLNNKFLSAPTLAIKALGLPLSIASGLSVGKEGPSVHYAVCAGDVVARLFQRYRRNATKLREIQTACAATGVAVAFASPIGGVLFSLEEISTKYTLRTMWKSYYCAMVGIASLAAWNPFRTGQLVMFQVSYDHHWHFFEITFYLAIGVFGGIYGLFVRRLFFLVQSFRKRRGLAKYAIEETAVFALITAMICYFNPFLAIDMTKSMQILFRECNSEVKSDDDFHGICEPSSSQSTMASLGFAVLVRTLLVIVSYGLKVPAGIFVPSMAIGAYFGRLVGVAVDSLYRAHSQSAFFSECAVGEDICITPGTYAFLGAAAALSGIMNLTVTVVVIMFELTGALAYILPTMIVVGVTKIINSRFGHTAALGGGGIADQAIVFNGMPFIDNKEDHDFHGAAAESAMTPTHALTVFPAMGATLDEVERTLEDYSFNGFPIVQDRNSMILTGYIGRSELQYAISKARASATELQPWATVFFTTPDQEPIRRISTSAQESGTILNTRQSNISSRPEVYESGPYDEELGAADLNRSTDVPLSELSGSSSTSTEVPHSLSQPSSRISYNLNNPTNQSNRSGDLHVDFAPFINQTPVTINPKVPLETVADLFVRVGPRVLLIADEKGKCVGLVTQKDLLRYQYKEHQ